MGWGCSMKKVNLNEVVWLGILMGYGSSIYYLFTSGKINSYIHPKMQGYVFGAMIVFGVLAIIQVGQIWNTKRSTEIKWGNFMFIIPLFLGVIFDPSTLGAKAILNKGVILEGNVANEKELQHVHNTLDGEQFKIALMNLQKELANKEGEEIELSGFVYKNSKMNESEFAIARLVMSCCAADSFIQGIRCEWEEAVALQDNEWIKIKATVKSIPYYDKDKREVMQIPLLQVKSLEVIAVPDHPYVYY